MEEVVEKVTVAPARAMGMLGEIGTLQPGSWADVAIFSLEAGAFEFADARGETRTGERRLVPEVTLRAGKIYRPEREVG